MKHGSLFSGVGGFDLAAQWMGWENKFHCEWNPFGQKVLNHYWPEAETFTDITKSDFTKYANRIDILTGGFPCQPYSAAGKRLGKEDDRHLFPEMLRVIREVQPRWVVGENVSGLITWNGGMVFDEVQADLEAAGYEVIPFVLPACGVNAPHRRDRVWFVAYRICTGRKAENGVQREWQSIEQEPINTGRSWSTSDTPSPYQQWNRVCQEPQKSKIGGCGSRETWFRDFPTQPPVRCRNDGLSERLAGITVSKHRNESIKAYGNAIVPQVVYQIFQAIQGFEINLK